MDESSLEQGGAEQLHHALNKKMIEMAQLLNSVNLKSISLDDPKDKTFDRIKIVWDSAAKVAEASKSLGQIAGIIKPDNDDSGRKPFNEQLADSRQ